MSKKVFKTLVVVLAIAAAATGPARAQSNTVRWEKFQISEFNLMSGDRETLYDVTLTSNGGTASDNGGDIQFNGAFTFSVPAGSVLTQIVIKDETWLGVTGWSRDESQTEATWTGSARSVACDITASNVQYIEFTIASAVRKMYTSEVSITDLVPGDTLAEGATIIGSGSDDDMVSLDFGRTKKNGVVPSFWENLGLPPTVIGTNGTISKTNNTYTPVDGNGQDGNAWVVTTAVLNDYDGFEVGLAGITIPVYRTLDSIPMGWTVKVGEAAAVSPTAYTDGGSATKGFLRVEQGQPVRLVPSAEDKPRVKSVTLVDNSTPPAVYLEATTTAWADGINYAVPAEGLTYGDAVTVNGNVTLTLTEGTTLTLNKGISMAEGATLTVTGPGTLVVNGAKGNDGASGWEGSNGGNGGVAISGNIIVQGGATVTATGGNGGNGGNGDSQGGNGGNGGVAFAGTLTYKSGTVTANGGSAGSGGGSEWDENGHSGSAGKAFANDVDFTQTTGYRVTNGTSTIGSVLNQTKVVISGGTPIPTGN